MIWISYNYRVLQNAHLIWRGGKKDIGSFKKGYIHSQKKFCMNEIVNNSNVNVNKEEENKGSTTVKKHIEELVEVERNLIINHFFATT